MFFPLLTTHRHTLSIVVLSPIVEKKQHRVIALMLVREVNIILLL